MLPPYIFIYILGYYLCWKANHSFLKGWKIPISVMAICGSIIIMKSYYGVPSFGYADPIVILMAASIFLLAKNLNLKWSVADKLAPICFGVYLIHPVFINVAYKFLNIDTAYVVPVYGWLMAGIVFSLLSFAGTYVMRLVPWLRNNIL